MADAFAGMRRRDQACDVLLPQAEAASRCFCVGMTVGSGRSLPPWPSVCGRTIRALPFLLLTTVGSGAAPAARSARRARCARRRGTAEFCHRTAGASYRHNSGEPRQYCTEHDMRAACTLQNNILRHPDTWAQRAWRETRRRRAYRTAFRHSGLHTKSAPLRSFGLWTSRRQCEQSCRSGAQSGHQ